MASFLDIEPVKLTAGSGRYKHRFGGPADYKGLVPSGEAYPVDLLFELDLTDPALEQLAEWFPDLVRLPLLAALHYNFAALEYRVLPGKHVEINRLGGRWRSEITFDPTYPYWAPGSLEQTPLVAKAIDEEIQALAGMADLEDMTVVRRDINPLLDAELKGTGYPWTQVGGRHKLMQGPQAWACGSECPAEPFVAQRPVRPYGYSHPVFATCWEVPVPGSPLFEESEKVSDGYSQMLWALCQFCRTIFCCNRCD